MSYQEKFYNGPGGPRIEFDINIHHSFSHSYRAKLSVSRDHVNDQRMKRYLRSLRELNDFYWGGKNIFEKDFKCISKKTMNLGNKKIKPINLEVFSD